MPELYRAVYCSRRCLASYDPLLDHEIEEILAASRKNNARDGLTGALLFSLGSFAQALEGPLTVLNATLERIKADPRHDEIRVLEFGRSKAGISGLVHGVCRCWPRCETSRY